MAIPIPLIAGLVGGGLGFGAGAGLFGKKEEHIEHAPYEYYAPTISKTEQLTYAPQVQYSPQLTYAYQGGTYIIGSPSAQSKKEQEVKSELIPEQKGTWEFPVTTNQEPHHEPIQGGVGTDLTKIAIIGAVGLIAYGLIRRR